MWGMSDIWGWQKGLEQYWYNKVSDSFEAGTREERFENLNSLQLPTLEYCVRNISEFQEKGEDIDFGPVHSHKLWVNLNPKDKKGKKERIWAWRWTFVDDIMKHVEKHGRKLEEFSTLTILEQYPERFGGNIVVDENGSVFFEFTDKTGENDMSTQKMITCGYNKPEDSYMYWLNPFTHCQHFTSSDPKIRKAIRKAMDYLQFTWEKDSKHKKYTPGYYEFFFVQKEENWDFEPIFMDCNQNKAYQLPLADQATAFYNLNLLRNLS